LPVVVSSALETSVGIRAGLALAAALPELPYACGLNTVALLSDDVAEEPLLATDGELAVGECAVDPTRLAAVRAPGPVAASWLARLVETQALLSEVARA
jgi:O-succinylbenzoate synthase